MTDPSGIDINAFVASLTTILGTVLGGAITLYTTRRQDRLADLKEREAHLSAELMRASEQVAAYKALEDEYAKDVASARGGVSARTIKTEYRNRVESTGHVRPRWTEDRARAAFETAAES